MEWFRALWLPQQASTQAHLVDALFMFITISSALLLAYVTYYLVRFAWVYRRRSHTDVPEHPHENRYLEMGWIVIPTILVMVVFFWGFRVFVDTRVAPANAYEVNVKAKKWLWEFHYNEGFVTTNELTVPVGVPVKLVMNATDVLHSFYVPDFRIKQDVLPGRYTTTWFQVDQPGTYQILCTEYCGTGHSNMGAKIHVVSLEEFQNFIGSGGEGDMASIEPVVLGEQVYRNNACVTCHSNDGSQLVGPSFQGHWGETRPFADGSSAVMDEEYVRESILQPNRHIVQGFAGVMPSYQGSLNTYQIEGVIAYIKSLNGVEPPASFAEVIGGAANDSTAAPTADPTAATP